MRILVGGASQESNTFLPVPAKLDDFEILRGSDILQASLPGQLEGIIDTLKASGAEIIPTVSAWAWPGGVVDREAYEAIKTELLEGVEKAGLIDGVCLEMHGSMQVEGIGSGESDLLAATRKRLSQDTPVTAALDMHANLTPAIIANLDGLVTYRTAPHVDQFETGQRAVELLLRIIREKIKTAVGFKQIPFMLPGEKSETSSEPMVSLIRLVEQTEVKRKILSASYAVGMPWADVPYNTVSAVVVTADDRQLAVAEAARLAEEFWRHRKEFDYKVEAYPVDQAIEVALSAPESTIFLSDMGDNQTAGASTDVPLVVERLLAKRVKSALVAAICDPAAVEGCMKADINNVLTVSIGGKLDKLHGRPLEVKGRVRLLHDGCLPQGGQPQPGTTIDMGPVAVLEVNGIDMVLSQKRAPIIDPVQLRSLGIEPLHYKIVVLKIGYLYAPFQAIAPRSILMLSPGCSNPDLTKLEYKNLERPVYPLDPHVGWIPWDESCSDDRSMHHSLR